MDALILAGGLGTRLRSVVSDRAKPVALIGDQPFLRWMMRRLACSGHISRFVLCTGHLSDTVQSALGHDIDGIPIRFSVESEPLGTGGALRLALARHDPVGALLVLNGDTFLGFDLARMLATFKSRRADFQIALAHVPSTARYGRVEMEADRIVAFGEKGVPTGVPHAGWINAGVYLVSPAGAERIRQSPTHCSVEQDIFPASLKAGRLQGYRSHARFIDIGVPEDYLRAQALFCRS